MSIIGFIRFYCSITLIPRGRFLEGRNDRNFPPPDGQAPIAEGTCDLQTNEDDGRADLQDVARVDSAWQTVPPATGRPTVRALLFASGFDVAPRAKFHTAFPDEWHTCVAGLELAKGCQHANQIAT